MKIINKAISLLVLVAVMLTSCSSLASATSAMPAIANTPTEVVEIQIAIPAITFTAAPTPLPTRLPSTETPPPTKTSLPISGTPTAIELEDDLTWSECIVPGFNSAYFEFATTCLNMDWAGWDDHNMMLNGQRLREERLQGTCGYNLRLVIGKDIYETSYTVPRENSCGSYNYELLKNGVTIATVNGVKSSAADPNTKLWNIGGKSVWEIVSAPPAENPSAIIVDGVNQNEKYQLEGSYHVYYLNDKIIFIALKNGKYQIVYNEKFIGPEFDQILLYGGPPPVFYGHGQYWFWGRREGTHYVVAIH